jgi:integrase
MKRILRIISQIKEEIDMVESYIEGKHEAAIILGENTDEAAFNFDVEQNCYIINDNDDPDMIIDKILEMKMGAPKLSVERKEEENLPKLKEGSITKRKDGRWMGRYYDNGVRRSVYARTQKEVINLLNRAIYDRNRRDNDLVISKAITLNKWIQEFIALYKSEISEASKKDYESHLVRRVKKHPIGTKKVATITPMDLDRFFLSIEAPTARHRTFILLRGCITKLYQTKIIKENPFDFINSIKKPRVDEKDIPTSAELDKFFDWLKEKDYGVYLFAKFISLTGVRGGEALALEWSDITDKISITKSFNTSTGVISKPKSYASIRSIPLFDGVEEVLQEIERVDKRIFGAISRWQSARKFSELATEYGLKKLSIHGLRHYFATQCLNAGIAEKVTTAWLGHHDSKVSKDVYQHIKSDFEAEQVKKLAKYRQHKE